MKRKHATIVSIALLSGLLLAGCSSGDIEADDSNNSMGSPVPEPELSASAPPEQHQSHAASNKSNREMLGDFRQFLLESVDHMGPGDGHAHADQETARIAQQFGHDHQQMSRELNIRLNASDAKSHSHSDSAFPAEKD